MGLSIKATKWKTLVAASTTTKDAVVLIIPTLIVCDQLHLLGDAVLGGTGEAVELF